MFHRRTPTGAGPLHRAADRARTRWHAVFVLACALAVIAGVLAALAVRDADTRTAQEQARHRHRVTATVVAEPTVVTAGRSGGFGLTARAVWRYPAAGAEHAGTITVPFRTHAHDRVPLWVDDGGRAAAGPASATDIGLNAAGLGACVCAATVLGAGAVVHLRLRRVEAGSLRDWDREWEVVEPLWTGRLRPGPGAGDD
ncbi:hypothetical protein [Streptomyces sp. NPDC093225]|uniref:Rv1733c family protein n=1 Tax=Streptomyces sp. NPDC093225 TaxID=3366034 RepID=UPI0037FE91A8